MAELTMDKDGDDEIVEKEEIQEDNLDMMNNKISMCTSSSITTSSSIRELNLVIILSFLSLSPGECLDVEDIDKNMETTLKDSKANHSSSRNSHIRQRETNEFRAPGSQYQRFQSKIKDCRHCRRL